LVSAWFALRSAHFERLIDAGASVMMGIYLIGADRNQYVAFCSAASVGGFVMAKFARSRNPLVLPFGLLAGGAALVHAHQILGQRRQVS